MKIKIFSSYCLSICVLPFYDYAHKAFALVRGLKKETKEVLEENIKAIMLTVKKKDKLIQDLKAFIEGPIHNLVFELFCWEITISIDSDYMAVIELIHTYNSKLFRKINILSGVERPMLVNMVYKACIKKEILSKEINKSWDKIKVPYDGNQKHEVKYLNIPYILIERQESLPILDS